MTAAIIANIIVCNKDAVQNMETTEIPLLETRKSGIIWTMRKAPYKYRDVLAIYSFLSAAGREHFSGIIEYLADRNDIRLHIIDPVLVRKAPGLCRLADYDGFIVSLDGGTAFMAKLSRSNKPTVLVNIDNPKLTSRRNVSCVWLDNVVLGKAGAQHLMAIRDFASYGFVSDENGQFYNDERAAAFRREISRNRPTAKILVCGRTADLADWLTSLPKPTAVMASSAHAARRVLDICRRIHIAIPSDLALLNVDPDSSLSELEHPAISSIYPDFRQMGRLAMKELDRLMSADGELSFHEVVISKFNIIGRGSTKKPLDSDTLAKKVVDYIHANANSPLSTSFVARAFNRSRRLLDVRLKAATGRTLHETILDERLSKAEELLRSGLSVKDVARQLRFTSGNYLTRAFAVRRGMTITSWRNAAG